MGGLYGVRQIFFSSRFLFGDFRRFPDWTLGADAE